MGFMKVFIYLFFIVLSLVAFNARGLSDFNKFEKVKEMFKNEDVIVLQETNWRETHICELRKRWNGEILYNNEDKRFGRGVAFLIRENTNIVCKVTYKDDVGKCLAVEMEYEDKKIVVINVHAPTEEKEKREYLNGFRSLLNKHKDVLLMGDVNTVLSKLDMADGMVFRNDMGRKEEFCVSNKN